MLGKIGKVCRAGLRYGGIGQWRRVNAKTPSTLERLADAGSEAVWQVCQEAARTGQREAWDASGALHYRRRAKNIS
jgi:hypothetical protein